MRKCYEDINMYIENQLNMSRGGVAVLTTVLGQLMQAENEETYNVIKEIADSAILRLLMEEIINANEFEELSGLLDECTFEEEYTEDEGLDFTKTTTDEAHGALKGGKLHLIQNTFHEDDSPSGVHLTFQFVQEDRMFYRDLYISNDGTIYISKEY